MGWRRTRIVVVLAAGMFFTRSSRGAEKEAPAPPPETKEFADQHQRELVQRRQLSAHHTDLGRQFKEAFQFQKAQLELAKALEYDPENKTARQLLDQVLTVLSGRTERVRALTANLIAYRQVEMRQHLLEIYTEIDLARRFLRQAESPTDVEDLLEKNGERGERYYHHALKAYDTALQHLSRAQEIIRWLPYAVDVQQEEEQLRQLTSQAQKGQKTATAELKAWLRQRDRELAQKLLDSQIEARRRKIVKMLDQAWLHYDREEYEKAEHLAREVEKLDYHNTEAKALAVDARQRHADQRRAFIQEEYRGNLLLNWEKVDRTTIPHSKYLIYPADWPEIVLKRKGPEELEARKPEWMLEIERALARKVSCDFMETPLSDAIKLLHDLTKVAFILDPKAVEANKHLVPITLKVDEMTAADALQWILRFADLTYQVEQQAVFIFQPTERKAKLEVRIYDIRDLVGGRPNFVAPTIELRPTGQAGGAGAGGAAGAGAAGVGGAGAGFPGGGEVETIEAATIAELIRQFVRPKSWVDTGASIQEPAEGKGQLLVLQTTEVHREIMKFLERLRQRQSIQVTIQVRFIDVHENFLEEIGVHFTGLHSPMGYTQLPQVLARGDYVPAPTGPGTNWRDGLFYPRGTVPYRMTQPRRGIWPTGGETGPAALPSVTQDSLFDWFDPNHPRSPNRPFGVRSTYEGWYYGMGTENRVRYSPLGTTTALGAQYAIYPGQGAWLQFRFVNNVQANAILHAVRKDQSADQLMAPKITVFNNQAAYVQVVRELAYVMDYDVSGDLLDPIIGSYQLGTILNVRPVVSHDLRYITMEIEPGTAELAGDHETIWIAVGPATSPIELPNILLRTLQTTVTVPDGGTLLLGGLINHRKIHEKTGIPLLMNLPVLGRLFRNDYKESEKRNLLILLTAKIILFDEHERNL